MTTATPIRSERRLGVIFAVVALVFAVMTARLAQLQFVRASKHEKKLELALTRTEVLPAFRGDLFDCEGRPLAETVIRYQLAFLPARFREENRIDALFDLLVAWCPEALPRLPAAIPADRLYARVEERLKRFRSLYEGREPAIQALLSLRTSDLDFDKEFLVDRFDGYRHPQRELVLPPSRLARRLMQALILVADNEVCRTTKTLRLRLAEHETLAAALDTDPERLGAALEADWERLCRLSDHVGTAGPEGFLRKLFNAEQRNIRRMLVRVEECVDDQICTVKLGVHDFATGSFKERLDELAAELEISNDKVKTLRHELARLAAEEAVSAEDDQKRAEVAAIMRGRKDPASLERFERERLSEALEAWDAHPNSVKKAYAARARKDADFRRGDYMSPEKEWKRLLQYKGGVPYTVFRDCPFEAAARVWRTFGLRDLGFSVHVAQGRHYWADETGTLSQLLGRCNSRGIPLGGLEAALLGPLDRDKKVHTGPLAGRDGRVVRRQEADKSLRILDTGREPRHGRDVRLTIDRELQQKAEALCDEMMIETGALKGAACCVIDIRTGEILVLGSANGPKGTDYMDRFQQQADFQRELGAIRAAHKAGDISKAELKVEERRIKDELEQLAFYERAVVSGLTGQSPAGSVLKPIAAAALVHFGHFRANEMYECREKGLVNAWSAIVLSSNPYFWEGAKRMGRRAIIDWYRRFGMMRPIPYLITERDCALRLRNVAENAARNIIIGQQDVNLSVLEVATMMMNLARRGRILTPTVIKRIGDEDVEATTGEVIRIDEKIWDGIFRAMEKVAAKYVGRERAGALRFAGKTGTAELSGRYDGLYNAWFAGFAPATNPRYAVAVVSERTSMMGKTTAPFAARLLELVEEARR